MAYPRALWQSAHLPLLQSKIQAPRRPPVTVRRQRLLERLEAAPEVKLTLISAPAGYGKSTLLRNWEQRQKQPVAWLTLDPEDNNTSRFARYLHATWISQVTTGTEENAQQEVGGSPPPLDQLLPRLLNRLEETSEPVTFLFDDVHHLESPAVLGGISFLVDNIPAHARVIIASRADPAIGLGRLRAHGWVNEIRSHDLRFNEKELAEFFEIQLGRSLPASDLVTLMERTEGWPAGLQLVAHLLKGQHDLTEIIKDFHGDHPYLFDYLAGEVLQGLDQDVKAFLLESSILPKLDTALCDEVLQRRNSGAMLEQLRAENLFLEPTEPSQSSFRYHPLFREHLQLRLSNKLDAAGQQQLHRRACRSLRTRGLPQLAIPHAVASGDLQAAVDLISDQSQQAMNVGDSASIKRWISWLPEQVIVDTPQLAIWHAWSLTVSGQLQEVEYWLESAESHPGYAGSSVPSAEEIQFHASTIRSTLSRFRGNTDRTIKESAHSLQLIPEDRPILRAIAQLNQGHARLLQGKVEAAVPLLEEAFHLADSAGHRYVALSAQYHLGKCHLAMGELDQAELTFKTADQATLAHGKEGLRCVYHLGMALLDLERHELDYAEENIETATRLSHIIGDFIFLREAMESAVRLHLIRRDKDSAAAAFRQLEELRQPMGSSDASISLAGLRARVEALNGFEDPSWNWAISTLHKSIDEPDPSQRGSMLDALALYRELAPSKVDGPLEAQILEMLSTSAEQAERDNRLLDRIRFGLLKNNFLTRGGRHEQATKVLRRTVTISPQGLSLPYLEQGAELRRRIKNLQEPVDDNSEDGKYSEKIKALIQAFDPHYGEDSVKAADLETSTKNSADPLSEREAEVLQLIAQGHSSREIAEALVITYNTVRTHIRNIYRKLDVHSRLEAVKRGQELQVV